MISLPAPLVERFRSDPYARFMGFELVAAGPGYARVEARVTPDVFNFAGVPHGGFVFSLADYAFAVASNSHGRVAVATSVSIQFMRAASAGDRLVAEARRLRAGRSAGFYEMRVLDGSGQEIAHCLGVVHRSERPLVDSPPKDALQDGVAPVPWPSEQQAGGPSAGQAAPGAPGAGPGAPHGPASQV
ncbi:MAG: hotdog fold thioesterase [Thermaerobacter sp.]|nr:phenylacetic acid degradation protein [Bacillota bacterium]REJ34873.1 MAG: phenylacetic acid degradation protein [Bacillota bacterium]